MSLDLAQFERNARIIGVEHRKAISESEEVARELARADGEYHKKLAVQIAIIKTQNGATVAEKLAQGCDEVIEAKGARDIAAARDRACMERIRLARDDRQTLLSIAGWSRANEAVE